MTILEAIILGLVQGLTEFLPISSSGHMILVGRFLGVGEVSVGFELICHLGTLVAVCLVLRRQLFTLVRDPIGKPMRLLIVASIPTAIIAGVISFCFRDILYGDTLVYCFLLTGILLLCCGFMSKRAQKKPMTYPHAAIIGVAQGIAALPGLSRSGTTIAAATMLGYDREQAAEFSFLLSIPIIVGSSIVELALNGVGSGVSFWVLIAALASSFVSGLLSCSLMLKLLKKHSMDGFAIYLFLLSIFLLLKDFVFPSLL